MLYAKDWTKIVFEHIFFSVFPVFLFAACNREIIPLH